MQKSRKKHQKLMISLWRCSQAPQKSLPYTLRSRIEAMERQEPVARFNWSKGELEWLRPWNYRTMDMKPLYLAPGAQPVPGVPEGFALVNAAHFLAVLDREDWRTAKNRAELRAMLAAAPKLGAQPTPSVPDEEAAYSEWFHGEQGVAYDGMWAFAKAAWMARAALNAAPKPEE
jgi:hypothetical protein